jgi:predicted Rossmann fold flavoprotein
MSSSLNIAVVGGGAAGFFAAISAKEHHPNAQVTIYEKSNKVLAKVKVSGGGRCNVTHACFDNKELSNFYPRGKNQLRKAFEQFNAQSTIDWFKKRGVELETLHDNCIFPKSNSSQTIIDCFEYEAKRLGISVQIQTPINDIRFEEGHFVLKSLEQEILVDRVIYTTGGQPKADSLRWAEKFGHTIVQPVPSLFTFNMPNEPIRSLMGIVVEPALVRVEKTKLEADGPLLITHWGMSGPAILKLSAFGARILAENNYDFAVLVNWLHTKKEDALRQELERVKETNADKKISNYNPFGLSSRLWEFLVEKSAISVDARWKEVTGKAFNKLVNTLLNDRYEVKGKTTFKEEFVTAGGIALDGVDFKTMESRHQPGLFFAGEVLDVDGVTGGFNFQAAWSTGWIAGKGVTVLPFDMLKVN